MKSKSNAGIRRNVLALAMGCAGWLFLPAAVLHAQCVGAQGNNAIVANCVSGGGLGIQGSSAYVDASAYASTSTDICATLYGIIQSLPASGAVIDARGISSKNSKLICAATTSPWYESSGGYLNTPSVILLPAETITIAYTWQLPNMTKIIGQGASSTGSTETTLTAATGFTGPTVSNVPIAMIQYGDVNRTGALTCGNGVCFDITVEDLTLNGGGQAIDGILNLNSQELTYAKNVSIYNLTGAGLEIGNSSYPNQAQNSGPYSNIYYSSGSATGTCAKIYGSTVRGIHGINCVASSNTGGAILLDSAGNTLEDVYISGFTEGVLIGSKGTGSVSGSGSVLLNVSGSSTVTTLIHICKPSVTSSNCPGTGGTLSSITDVSILGVTAAGTNSIKDDMSTTTLPVTTDAHVGMYALGEAMGSSGFSHFSTSKSYPTWYVGNFDISGTCTGLKGSLYSNNSTSSTALFVCAGGSWTAVN